MIEAVMLWNEPNNLSHWDFEIDKDWSAYANMVKQSALAIGAENPRLSKVLGGISPIDPAFIIRMHELGALEHLDVVAVHGFPLDWNHWNIHDWPDKLDEIRAVTAKPIWVSEVGASSFGAEEVQDFGLKRTAELLMPRVDHIYWYSLFDLPRPGPPLPAIARAKDRRTIVISTWACSGKTAPASWPRSNFANYTPALGICQWFHFEDHRLDHGVQALRDLGVKKLRTGLSWADFERPGAEQWFDHQMVCLEDFELTVTFCFTPERCGLRPHHTSPPQNPEEFAEFCAAMTRRYAI